MKTAVKGSLQTLTVFFSPFKLFLTLNDFLITSSSSSSTPRKCFVLCHLKFFTNSLKIVQKPHSSCATNHQHFPHFIKGFFLFSNFHQLQSSREEVLSKRNFPETEHSTSMRFFKWNWPKFIRIKAMLMLSLPSSHPKIP